LGTVHNALARAIGARIRTLPMSPSKVYAALESRRPAMAAD
jgi:CO/xanthine dehydrogenase Mo-binding subunit